MRQTSRAVALLLTLQTAQAASSAITKAATSQEVPTAFNPVYSGVNTASNQMSSRTAGYTNPSAANWSWSTVAYKTGVMDVTIVQATATTVAGSGCMQCLNSAGVWCSRTYSFLVTTGSVFQQSVTSYATGDMTQQGAGSDTLATVGQYDGGSCCASTTDFVALVGATAVPAVGITYAAGTTAGQSGATAGVPLVMSSCVAIDSSLSVQVTGGSGTANAFGISTIKGTVDPWQSWWCSNGLYNTTSGTSNVGVLNGTQILPASANQRLELAQVACPQIASFCGQTSSAAITSILTPLTATGSVVIDVATTSLLTTNDKCTWVAWSYVAAPTFTLADGAAAKGIATLNWQIHAMEYTTGAYSSDLPSLGYLAQNGVNTGYVAATVALQQQTFVPLFNMPAAQFANLRTWYGAGGSSLQASTLPTSGNVGDWLSPYQNSFSNTLANSALIAPVMGQLWGNVANFPQSTQYSGTAAVTASTTMGYTYGAVGSSSTKFDLRVIRYVPAQAAVSTHAAGLALATSYTTALTTYAAAKLTWDAYVAILVKNAKQDAFAALFSPPKSPTVPPLPNKPWAPAAYAGYVKQTPAEAAIMAANTGILAKASQPTSQQFWTSLLAAQTIGGWGSFTAQVITYRNLWGKSFGTIGYSGDSSALLMSAVWNYKWTCGVTTGQSSAATCDQTYTVATADTQVAAGTDTSANSTVKLISVVSLWANGNTGSTTAIGDAGVWLNMQDLKLTWTSSAWSQALAGLSAIAAPVAATDATQLTGVAGAHALAASAAAALTVAAALY